MARVAVAVAHRVEAGQVGERLARAQHVVGAHGSGGVGKLDLDELGALGLELGGGFLDLGLHLGREALGAHERRHHADAHAAHACVQVGGEIGFHGLAGAVEHVVAGYGVQQVRGVGHRAGERAHLVERAAEGDDAVARHHAVRGLHAHHAAEGRRLTDGAAGVRPEGQRHEPGRDRRGASAGRAAWHARDVPRVVRGAEGARFGGRPERELVHVQLAQRHHPCVKRALHRRGRVGRDVALQHVRRAGGVRARHVHVVLVGNGDAGQGPHGVEGAAGDGIVDVRRLGAGGFFRHLEEGVHPPVLALDTVEHRCGHLSGRELPGGEPGMDFDGAHGAEGLARRHQRSPPSPRMDGIRKLPSCCLGAFSSATRCANETPSASSRMMLASPPMG